MHFAVFEISARDKLRLDEIEAVGAGYAAIFLRLPGLVALLADLAGIDDHGLDGDVRGPQVEELHGKASCGREV